MEGGSMAGASGGSRPAAPEPSSSDAAALDRYVEANRDRYTRDALEAALLAAGHSHEEVQAALRRAEARIDVAPTMRRARRVILIAYGLTYLVLAVGIIGYYGSDSAGIIETLILTISLGTSFAIALWWLRRRRQRAGLVGLVALPLVLLVAVAGTCMFTTWTPFLLIEQMTSGRPAFEGAPGPAPDATAPGPAPAPTQPPP
jgi:uncharacterized membrane protein (UPF0136 family)